MNPKYTWLLVYIIFGLSVSCQKGSEVVEKDLRPKLVIGIVVDQMRWDYLYRFYNRYEEGGFKRMLNEGFSCDNTYIDYVSTVTAVGHATIYTGSVPAIHGITGNDFFIQTTGTKMYCAGDTTVQTVGSTSAAGKMSPRNLLATTITDELKLATNFRAKVIGISLKDRGAILPAGHAANAAYWFDGQSGNWITSTYYMETLPAWVTKFNDGKLAEKYLKQDWNTLYDINTYVQSSPDNNRYESSFSGMEAPTFPVKTSEMYGNGYNIIRTTPYGNSITLDFAKASIENEQLGQDEITDFLTVSLSATDYVGHKFGVNSIEVEDTYLRLDRDLSNFFDYMDKKIGKGNYTVFLSADHGSAHNPNFLSDHKIPAGLWQGGQVQKALNKRLENRFHVENIVTTFSNFEVQFNQHTISNNTLNEDEIRKECVNYLGDLPGVAFVVDMKNLGGSALPELIKNRLINGYNADRSGPITIILEPGWYSGPPNTKGSTHGSWYPYDAHVPLLWMGWGIPHGRTTRKINMTDISPTLAAHLHIQEPNGSIGKPITELGND